MADEELLEWDELGALLADSEAPMPNKPFDNEHFQTLLKLSGMICAALNEGRTEDVRALYETYFREDVVFHTSAMEESFMAPVIGRDKVIEFVLGTQAAFPDAIYQFSYATGRRDATGKITIEYVNTFSGTEVDTKAVDIYRKVYNALDGTYSTDITNKIAQERVIPSPTLMGMAEAEREVKEGRALATITTENIQRVVVGLDGLISEIRFLWRYMEFDARIY